MALNNQTLEIKKNTNVFVLFTYARENTVGEEKTLDKVSCKPTIKSSCGSVFNKSARSATEAIR
jgi:hypothetical protein